MLYKNIFIKIQCNLQRINTLKIKKIYEVLNYIQKVMQKNLIFEAAILWGRRSLFSF